MRRWSRFAVGTFRLAILFAAFACLHALPEKANAPDPNRLLEESRKSMPSAVRLGDASDGMVPLLNHAGATVGWATTTYPQAEKILGYSGPSELLILFDAHRKVQSVSLLGSADTAGHVAKIRNAPAFWEQWKGRPEAALGAAPAT